MAYRIETVSRQSRYTRDWRPETETGDRDGDQRKRQRQKDFETVIQNRSVSAGRADAWADERAPVTRLCLNPKPSLPLTQRLIEAQFSEGEAA